MTQGRIAVAVVFCLAAFLGSAWAQNVEREIEKLETERAAAVVKGDVATLDKETSDDYTFISANGQMSDKSQTLNSIKSGDTKLTADETFSRKIRDLPVLTLSSPVDGDKQMVGFSVCFHTDQPSTQFGHASVCTWSGWIRNNTLTTRWLLTRNVRREEDEWSSTIVGQDSFEKLSDEYDEKHLTASRQELEQLLKEAITRRP